MKREDFEELVRLLRAWLQAAKGGDPSGENAHSSLGEWAERHSQADVQTASDRCAMGLGWRIDTNGSPVDSFAFPGGHSFPTAIASLDDWVRQVVKVDFHSAVTATAGYVPPQLYPNVSQGRLKTKTILASRRIDDLISLLGEELKHLESIADEAKLPEDAQKCLTKPEIGKRQKETFDHLADKCDRIRPEMSVRDAAKESVALAKESKGKFLSFNKDTAGKLMNQKWPDRKKDKSS